MLQFGIYVKTLLLYLASINLLTFFTFAWDKGLARRQSRRISEMTLLCLSAVGGTVGGLLAMYLFRHKTRHIKFTWGLPILLILQMALLYYFIS